MLVPLEDWSKTFLMRLIVHVCAHLYVIKYGHLVLWHEVAWLIGWLRNISIVVINHMIVNSGFLLLFVWLCFVLYIAPRLDFFNFLDCIIIFDHILLVLNIFFQWDFGWIIDIFISILNLWDILWCACLSCSSFLPNQTDLLFCHFWPTNPIV